MRNKIKEVAKIIGVELEEKFNIVDYSQYFKTSHNGLYNIYLWLVSARYFGSTVWLDFPVYYYAHNAKNCFETLQKNRKMYGFKIDESSLNINPENCLISK